MERIAQASLLTRTADEGVWVHRWTAEVLRSRLAPYRQCCRRGEYLTSGKRSVSQGLEAARLFLAAQEFDRASEEGENVAGFLMRYGQVADLAAVTRELAESLPADHPRHYAFVMTEADTLRQRGLSNEALTKYQLGMQSLEDRVRALTERADCLRDLGVSYGRMGDLLRDLGRGEAARAYYQNLLDIVERLVRQEPERADYLRELSVAYNRMGQVLLDLGQGGVARAYHEKRLGIVERLARQEPERVDFQWDLVASLWRMGDRNSQERALGILERLDGENKLTPEQRGAIPALEAALRASG